MPRKKTDESVPSAEDFLKAAIESTEGLVRRPDLSVSRELAGQLESAVRKAGGTLMLPLERAVELLSIHQSYAKPGASAALLASSLSRRFKNLGLKNLSVGTANKGKVLVFKWLGQTRLTD